MNAKSAREGQVSDVQEAIREGDGTGPGGTRPGGAGQRPANAAFFYHPDGYDTSRPKLVGRHSAGEGFLKGFVRHAGVERFHCHALRRRSFDHFETLVKGVRPAVETDWIPAAQRARLADVGCLFVPGPGLGGEFAWNRRRIGERAYSLCGVTHTTATHAIMDGMLNLLIDPVQSWDAVVCTSRVVRDSLGRVLKGYRAHLGERLGATSFTLPQMPIIPLGVECDDMATDEAARARWRKKLGIGDDDVMVLFMGRLSFFEKAHPMPMYLGLEQAAKAAEGSGRKVHLVEAGWFPNDSIEKSFEEAVAATLSTVRHHFLDGRKPEVRQGIWHAADVFCSLSDNIQETFGLTPIEAMAAGLPVVVTDWDGYKDTVRDGEDGFRIRTLMPAPGLGSELADRFFDGYDAYGRYCGYASQMTMVDVAATAEAFQALIEQPERRRTMGEAGRRRAREVYDWRVVVGQYQALWAELEQRRAAGRESGAKTQRHPGRECPFTVFQSYPTSSLRSDHRVSLAPGTDREKLSQFVQLKMVSFAKEILGSEKELLRILDHLERSGPLPAKALSDQVSRDRRRAIVRTVLWLAKHGLVRIDEP